MAASPDAPRPAEFSPAATAIRKAAHTALARVSEDIERLRFNRCVAHIYEFANALQSAPAKLAGNGGIEEDAAFALREASDILVQLFNPMMPHLAEECWAVLDHAAPLATQPWPVLESALLIEDRIVLPVQVNGRKRADVEVPRDAPKGDVEAAALALEAVIRALDGKPPKKVIVVPQRIVNVVA
jgi:leucyl-tRNA synthetase